MAGEKISEAVRILAALVGVAQDPTLLSALKAGPGLRDSLKKIATSPPASFARLADDLGQSGTTVFAALPEKPRDAEVLYLQMVEAGLPDPARIMADRMDAEAVTEGMLAGLTEREHRDPAMQALFRALTQPALERLLADKAFAADLTPAFMRTVLENFAGLAEKLDSISSQGKDVLELLAVRFEIPRVYDLSDAQFRDQLELRAADYRCFQARIEAIDERTRGLGHVKAAARDAAAHLDFARVEALLSSIDGVETQIAVEAKLLRADNALLRGRPEQAFTILSAAADSFAGIDREEPALRRLCYHERLYDHGDRYGGAGLVLAARMIRDALEALPEADYAEIWAGGQNNRGNALALQAKVLGGSEDAALLEEAAKAYRIVLRYWTEAAHPESWAMTQNSLGSALQRQAELRGGSEGVALLGQVREAYRAAQRVWTEAAAPVPWAVIQDNLGYALLKQGRRLGGSEGAALLSEAAEAYCAALRGWTETTDPLSWATTMEALGLALEALAENGVAGDPRHHLVKAAKSFEAALRNFDPADIPYRHARATAALARVRAKLAALPDPA